MSEFVDLSRGIQHRTPPPSSHPPVAMGVWNGRSGPGVAGNAAFTPKAVPLSMSDHAGTHAGTHVDAPAHFDPRPGAATAAQVQAAVAASGRAIQPGDTPLIRMTTVERFSGVEAISPAPEGEPDFQAHVVCAGRGITRIECLWNLKALSGRGRFTFIGFPLKRQGGTASPVRAAAAFPWMR